MNAKNNALKKVKVQHQEGGKLLKLRHALKDEVKFTGKGGFAKNFGKKAKY